MVVIANKNAEYSACQKGKDASGVSSGVEYVLFVVSKEPKPQP
jgi:hypothetical protein